MHAKQLLQKQIKSSSRIHQNRLEVLLVAGESLLGNGYLTVTRLGRGIRNKCKPKHNINRMDRLIGNEHLYKEKEEIYEAIGSYLVGAKKKPVVLVDWSSLTPGEEDQVLRASVAVKGRSVTLYEEVYELSDYNKPKVHKAFLKRLKKLLPKECCPTIVTDAGFGVPWFFEVKLLGWNFVGRIRNKSYYKTQGAWKKIPDLLRYKLNAVKELGEIELTKVHKLRCFLQVYKKKKKGKVCYTVYGGRSFRSVSVKSAKREKEPWIIASSFGKGYTEANRAIKLYGKRMQIEESFRDLKSNQFGQGLSYSRSKGKKRLSNLLLVSLIGSVLGWLIGLCAKAKELQYAFQVNTVRDRNELSIVFLAKEVVRNGYYRFKKRDYVVAWKALSALCLEQDNMIIS